MRRNGTRFALISVGERGHQTLLLRLSAVLRNTLVMCGKRIKHWNFFHKTTCPAFRPSLPPGLLRMPVGVTCQRLAGFRRDGGWPSRWGYLSALSRFCQRWHLETPPSTQPRSSPSLMSIVRECGDSDVALTDQRAKLELAWPQSAYRHCLAWTICPA